MLHHTCVPTHPEDTPQNLRPQDLHLTHPSFELCRRRMCANPEPTSQRYTTKPQTLRFLSHIPVLNFAGTACEPTHPEPTSQDTLQTSIRKFSSHTSLFRTLPEQLGTDDTTYVCQPILNQRSKDTPQNLRPDDFYLTSLF